MERFHSEYDTRGIEDGDLESETRVQAAAAAAVLAQISVVLACCDLIMSLQHKSMASLTQIRSTPLAVSSGHFYCLA